MSLLIWLYLRSGRDKAQPAADKGEHERAAEDVLAPGLMASQSHFVRPPLSSFPLACEPYCQPHIRV
jgi:hypothetical protein